MDRQNKQIEKQFHTIVEQNKQLNILIENMNEGVVVFNQNGSLFRINENAKLLFKTRDCSNYLTLNEVYSFYKQINRGKPV